MEENNQERIALAEFSERISVLRDQVSKVIVGQQETVDLVLTAVIAGGHVLIEGVPTS